MPPEASEKPTEWLWCEHCQRNIPVGSAISHLAQDLMKVYVAKTGRRTNEMAYDRAVDVFSSMTDEHLIECLKDINVLDGLADEYDRDRTDIIMSYPPLDAWLEGTVSGRMHIRFGNDVKDIFVAEMDSAKALFINLVNEKLTCEEDRMMIVDSGNRTCTLVSNHLQVPGSWIGVEVELTDYLNPTRKTTVKPVRCGNSVHLTIPKEWGDVLVMVKLVPLRWEL